VALCSTSAFTAGHCWSIPVAVLQVAVQAVKALGIIVCLHSENKEALVFRELVPSLMATLQLVCVCVCARGQHLAPPPLPPPPPVSSCGAPHSTYHIQRAPSASSHHIPALPHLVVTPACVGHAATGPSLSCFPADCHFCPHAPLQCLQNFDEKDAISCLDVISDMAESPLPFLMNAVDTTARCMAQVCAQCKAHLSCCASGYVHTLSRSCMVPASDCGCLALLTLSSLAQLSTPVTLTLPLLL
jgi:hypothetical protein